MFYAHFVLAKKGPLARVWLAAHWDKKLTKAHVFETNIESSVEGMLQPKVKMALRTSGHLLLGIVRIYSRKAKYLLADCNEAFIKIKMAFRPGVVDLPEGNREAAVATITLPEVFHDFDTAMPDINLDIDAQVTLNQSRAEDITLKEDYGTLSLMADDGFEDMGFEEPEAVRDAAMEEGFDHASLLLGVGEEQSKEHNEETPNVSNVSMTSKPNVSLDAPLKDDGFGGTVGEGLLDGETGGLFEPAGLFDDAPLSHVALENSTQEQTENVETTTEKPPPEPQPPEDDSDDDMYDMGPGSTGAPSPLSSVDSPAPQMNGPAPETDTGHTQDTLQNNIDLGPVPSIPPTTSNEILPPPPPEEIPPPPVPPVPAMDHTTLIHNEDESFALAPLDATIVQGTERTIKAKRKRKLIVDDVKNISGEEMKSQLSDTSDIVTTLDLAPPTKRLMHWKETGGVEKLFALPGHAILSKTLSRAYQRHLTTRSVDNEDFGIEEDKIDLDADLEQAREDPEISGMPHKRHRRDMDQVLPQDLSHLDTLHLESSRSYNREEQSLSHPSMEVPSFLQPQQHLFPMPDQSQQQQQMMSSVLQHPPHMIQHMLQPDVNQLSHLPQMMHHPSMVDQTSLLHPYVDSVHPHSVMEPVADNLLQDTLTDTIQEPPSMDKQQMPPIQSPMSNQIPGHSDLANQMQPNQMQPNQMQPSQMQPSQMQPNQMQPNQIQPNQIQPNSMLGTEPPVPNNLAPPSEMVNDHVLPPSMEEEATQPCPEYSQPVMAQNSVPPASVPMSNGPDHQLQKETSQPPADDRQTEANLLFDSLNNGDVQLQTQQLNNLAALNAQKSDHPLSDDDDDYGAPGSVGPALPEEQMADETYEQFEERILTKRTTHMLHIIHSRLERDNYVSFGDLVRNAKRKQVAQKFYTFLVLKKQQAVELEQNSSYGELIITTGPKFNAVYNSN